MKARRDNRDRSADCFKNALHRSNDPKPPTVSPASKSMLRPSFTEARSRRTSIQGKDRLPNGHMSTAPDLRIGKHEKANGAIPKHLSMGGAHASNGPGGDRKSVVWGKSVSDSVE